MTNKYLELFKEGLKEGEQKSPRLYWMMWGFNAFAVLLVVFLVLGGKLC